MFFRQWLLPDKEDTKFDVKLKLLRVRQLQKVPMHAFCGLSVLPDK